MAEDNEATLAVLDTKLDGVCDKLDEMHKDIKETNGRVRDHEKRLVRAEERIKTGTGALLGLSVLGNAIAAWLGVKN